MKETQKPTALITGASSGIGLELAKCAVADGFRLIIVAQATVKLDQAEKILREQYGAEVEAHLIDLSKPGSAQRVYDVATQGGRQIDVLINNAGFGDFDLFAEADAGKISGMMAVNMVTLTELTRLVLPDMLKRGQGRVLNVASTAAFQPGPLMAVYYATKAYVLHLTEALSEETRGTGVTFTALCPGPTSTNFEKRADLHESRLFHGRGVMHARDVAVQGWLGLMAGHRIVVPGWRNRLLSFSVRFVPRALTTKLVKQAQAKDTSNS
jgi:short-subunit dehydrogenase